MPENSFDDSVDLVVWGHEHEQRIIPESVAEKAYHISQPGSSVATSIVPGEAVEKRVAIVHVDRQDFMVEPIMLRTVRPFVSREIVLATEAAAAQVDTQDRTQLAKLLRRHVRSRLQIESLITEANAEWDARQSDIPPEARPERMLPIVRIRVLYDAPIPLGNTARFGQEFTGRIANTRDILQLHLRRTRKPNAPRIHIDNDRIPAEKLERISLEQLVEENLGTQRLDVLNAGYLQSSVMQYINKDERDAIEMYVRKTLAHFENTLEADGLDEGRIQAHIERLCGDQRFEQMPEIHENSMTVDPQPTSEDESLLPLPQPSPPRQRRRTQEPAQTPRSGRLAALDMTATRRRRR